jgi:prevent-host-death family protein
MPRLPLRYRNRRGEQVRITTVTATDAKNEFGRVLETALTRGAVAITRHDTPRAVLLSVDEFDALTHARPTELDTLRGEFDAMLARMQAPAARGAQRSVVAASASALGKAAVAAARKKRRGG